MEYQPSSKTDVDINNASQSGGGGGDDQTPAMSLEVRFKRLEVELHELREQMMQITAKSKPDGTNQLRNARDQERSSRAGETDDADSTSSDITQSGQPSPPIPEEDLLSMRREWMIRKLQRKLQQLTKEDEIFSKPKRDRHLLLEREPQEEGWQGSLESDLKGQSTPYIARVDWATFTAKRSREESDPCVIDVLMEDPDIAWGVTSHARRSKQCGLRHHTRDYEIRAGTPDKQLLPERIRIHSRYIISVLETIHGNPLVDDDRPVVMIRPFKTLAYYDERIRQKLRLLETRFGSQSDVQSSAEGSGEATMREEKDEFADSETALKHLRCLVEFMDTDIQAKRQYVASDRCKAVTFTEIWYLFEPGEEVVDNTAWRQAYQVVHIRGATHKAIPQQNLPLSAKPAQTSMILTCACLDFDGTRLGHVPKKFVIQPFEGQRSIQSLPVYPLRFVPPRESGQLLREILIKRGSLFLEATRIQRMYYSGPALETGEEVDSLVTIDFEEAFSPKNKRSWRPVLEALGGTSMTEVNDGDAADSCREACCANENVHMDEYVDERRFESYIANLSSDGAPAYPLSLQQRYRTPISDRDLVVMNYRVFGFVFHTRKWAKLDLNHLRQVKPIDEESQKRIFDSLVLPAGQKELISALVSQHLRDKEPKVEATYGQDIIMRKGEGLIILLHGPPGVGKRSIAGKYYYRLYFSDPLLSLSRH